METDPHGADPADPLQLRGRLGKTRVSLDEDWLKPVDDLKQNL